jgi:hypothetical protein
VEFNLSVNSSTSKYILHECHWSCCCLSKYIPHFNRCVERPGAKQKPHGANCVCVCWRQFLADPPVRMFRLKHSKSCWIMIVYGPLYNSLLALPIGPSEALQLGRLEGNWRCHGAWRNRLTWWILMAENKVEKKRENKFGIPVKLRAQHRTDS